MPWWGWIVLGAVVLLSEVVVSTDFYLVFFAAGAIIVGLLGLLGLTLPVPAQWLLFASLSVVTLLLFRSRLRRAIKTREDVVDNLQEEIVTATEAIVAGATGQAELRGSTWSAKNTGSTDIQVGDRCRVVRVEGVVLSVRKEP